MPNLSGQTVLITGASGTVGQACLQAFLAAGANVMLTDRAAPPPGAASHPNVGFAAGDVTDPRGVDAVFAATLARFGQIDAAVLAAGVEGCRSTSRARCSGCRPACAT
jgi:NAD(P)-dependent dehydrogenase (short-subunit alcohol dehydrogenase family)